MHVAINAAFWNQPHTGSGQYTRQLVYHLNRLVSDLTITLIFPQWVGESAPEAVPPSVAVKLVPVPSGNLGKVWFEQVLFSRACREVGATLAHVPYWGGPLQSPVPLVVTVHDLTTLLLPEYRRPFLTRLYNALVSASARGATRIITDSEASKQDITTYLHIPADKISRIYLAASDQFNSKDGGLMEMAILRKYDLPDFYLLYLGGYELHKNVTTLLLAWTYVGQALGEDYPLILAGRKPTETSAIYPDYDAYIEQLGIGEYVRWLGYVDEEDKPVLYRNAETFIFPSRHEGFGLGVVEAMASGTPVVTSNVSSLPEVVGEAGFTVDPDDARSMAGAIISTVIQDNLRSELRQKGEQQAATFSWEKTATETLLVYDSVLNSEN